MDVSPVPEEAEAQERVSECPFMAGASTLPALGNQWRVVWAHMCLL